MHYNLRPRDAEPFSVLTESPVPSLKWVNLAVAVLWRFYWWYVTLTCDPDLRTLTLIFALYRLWRVETTKFEHTRTSLQLSYCDLNIWPYDLEHVSRVQLCSPIIRTKFKPSQPIPSWNVSIFMLTRYVTLWPWPLTGWSLTVVVHQVSGVQSLYEIWAKSNNNWLSLFSTFLPPLRHAVTLQWPLTPWPWTFVVHGASRVETQYEIW